MFRLISGVLIILVFVKFCQVSGYKWVSLESCDLIPENAVLLDPLYKVYVGRARHFNLILPAEVINSTNARVSCCSKTFSKQQFEVLVATEECDWKAFQSIADVPENVVRGGTAADGEPIFIGSTHDEDSSIYMLSIFLSKNELQEWPDIHGEHFALVCNDNSKWVDTSPKEVPRKAISGGKTEEGNSIYVARLLHDCTVVPGQLIPELGIALAVYQNASICSSYCQVLVGEAAQYSWILAEDGEIPDYAVVAGKRGDSELMYVARINKTLGYVVHGEQRKNTTDYEFLVNNFI